jgi:uncharacterized protein (DUF433 family)
MSAKQSTDRPPSDAASAGSREMPAQSWIEKTSDVCGGDACIRHTRITVRLLVEYRQEGLSDSQLLECYPSLTPTDLATAWEYYEHNKEEIEAALAREREA